VPPGSSLVEIDLIERDGGTLLRMTHSGLPNEAQCAGHNRGWAHYVAGSPLQPSAEIPASIMDQRSADLSSGSPAALSGGLSSAFELFVKQSKDRIDAHLEGWVVTRMVRRPMIARWSFLRLCLGLVDAAAIARAPIGSWRNSAPISSPTACARRRRLDACYFRTRSLPGAPGCGAPITEKSSRLWGSRLACHRQRWEQTQPTMPAGAGSQQSLRPRTRGRCWARARWASRHLDRPASVHFERDRCNAAERMRSERDQRRLRLGGKRAGTRGPSCAAVAQAPPAG